MKNFLYNFMMGRYGPDHLGFALIIFSFILSVIYAITGYMPVLLFSYVSFAVTLFRMLSRNLKKRRAENDKFIKFWWPVRMKIHHAAGVVKNRMKHRYFKCPSCKTKMRVPRGIGKLRVTCSKCSEKLFMKS